MRKIIVLTALSLLLVNCMSFSDRAMRPVRNSITSQMPEIRLEKEMAVAVGGGMFNFLDVINTDDVDLSAVDHLQVAVYQVYPRGGEVNFSDEVFQESLLAKDASLTWERIVKVREEDEQDWVFVGINEKDFALEAVSVFVFERDELVMINMDGDLNQMLEYAFEPARGHRGAYIAEPTSRSLHRGAYNAGWLAMTRVAAFEFAPTHS